MADPDTRSDRNRSRRDVVVPLPVYKTVIVFSTLFAVVSVVAGFLLLDEATRRATLPASQIDPVLTAGGLGLIAFGAAVYAFASRFRTAEMGKDKDNRAEESSDG